jgi:hypothetical protein
VRGPRQVTDGNGARGFVREHDGAGIEEQVELDAHRTDPSATATRRNGHYQRVGTIDYDPKYDYKKQRRVA